MLPLVVLVIIFSLGRTAPNDHCDLANANINTRIRSLKYIKILLSMLSILYPHREFFEPYALVGDKPKDNNFPANLSLGEHLIHAYPDDDIRPGGFGSMIWVQVRPDFPSFGPLPTEVVPRPLKQKEMPVSEVAPTCNRTVSDSWRLTSQPSGRFFSRLLVEDKERQTADQIDCVEET